METSQNCLPDDFEVVMTIGFGTLWICEQMLTHCRLGGLNIAGEVTIAGLKTSRHVVAYDVRSIN